MVVYVKFTPWDRPYEFRNWVGGRLIKAGDFKDGDLVVVKTNFGIDAGYVTKIESKIIEPGVGPNKNKLRSGELRIILRKATSDDLEKFKKREESKKELIDIANELIKKYKLSMKLIDLVVHFDGGRVTFAFTAPERIDFRDLVRDLSQCLHKSIKMYQIGARQEMIFSGDIGVCGCLACCRSFLKAIQPVSAELIFDQQLTHRGADRLLGVCGRLKCCLLYEEALYKELGAMMPAVGAIVKIEQGRGKVVDRHLLKETITLEMENGTLIEVPIKETRE